MSKNKDKSRQKEKSVGGKSKYSRFPSAKIAKITPKEKKEKSREKRPGPIPTYVKVCSPHPAMSVKKRGARSLAGLIA